MGDTDHVDYVEKIKAWIHTEIARARAKGACDAAIDDRAFRTAMGERFCVWFKNEFRDDPTAWDQMWREFMVSGNPTDLRETARRLRAVGDYDTSYHLEVLADHREH
jgi:hypothetical protein